jgi:hypothetical protein
MIRFFLLLIILYFLCIYIKKASKDYYFNYKQISDKYNLYELNYIYYDEYNQIRKDKMIILKSDIEDIMNILEILFNSKIKRN